VPHFPQFCVYEVYTYVPYDILMQGILLTALIKCRLHLWYTVKRLILKHVISKYFRNILPVWVHLYTISKDFEYVAIVCVGSSLFPFYLRTGAGLALKTLLSFNLRWWTVSRISLTTVQSYKFSLLGTTLKNIFYNSIQHNGDVSPESICVVCSSVLVTYVVWSNLMMLQQFLTYFKGSVPLKHWFCFLSYMSYNWIKYSNCFQCHNGVKNMASGTVQMWLWICKSNQWLKLT